METPELGDVFLDKYTVERKLGRGGMGVVLAVRHRHLGELHALKFITGMCTPEAMERFRREGQAGAQLRGQHVAHVHDLGKLPNGVPYMVMEYLQGSDLKTLLYRDGPFPVADVIRYLLQTCEAIAEAHDAGIIHRDIKPSNLFLWDRPYGEPCIKVLDFGISKYRFHDEEALTLTKGFLGSPQYMSPEQIASPKNVDARSDIWSLGIVLYELLVGTTPFHSGTILAMINQIVKDDPKPPRHYRPSVPASLESVVMRCLQKPPDDRFQQVEDLAAALLKVQAELTMPAAPTSLRVPMELLADPLELLTPPLRDEFTEPVVSNPRDVTVSVGARPEAKAEAFDTTTRRVLTRSELGGEIVSMEHTRSLDSGELALIEATQSVPEMEATSSDEIGLSRKLRPRTPVVLTIAAALLIAAIALMAFVPQSSSVSAAPASASVPRPEVEQPQPVPSTSTSANLVVPENVEPQPAPMLSASANPEKRKPVLPLPVPKTTTKKTNKPLAPNVKKPQSSKKRDSMRRWDF